MSHPSCIEPSISLERQSAARISLPGRRLRPVQHDNAGRKHANRVFARPSHTGVREMAADHQICRHAACFGQYLAGFSRAKSYKLSAAP